MPQEEAENKGLEEYGVVTGRKRRVGYFKVGDDVDVKILSISSTERHLGLSLKAAKGRGGREEEKKEELSQEDLVTAVDSAIDEELGKKKVE